MPPGSSHGSRSTGDLGTAIVLVAAVLVSIGSAAVPSGSTDPTDSGSVPTCSSPSRLC